MGSAASSLRRVLAFTVALALAPASFAQVALDKLADFGAPPTGRYPDSGVIEGSDGRLYGTTGGGDDQGYFSAIWSSERDGSDLTVLARLKQDVGYGLTRQLCDGGNGFLYGVAHSNGANGCGTLFRIALDGSAFAVLHDFTLAEGRNPNCRLLLGSDGQLYGSAYTGGVGTATGIGYGSLFTIALDGSGFTVLHYFSALATGVNPYAGLIEGSDGALYGTTRWGGAANGAGVIFTIQRDGSGYTVLHTFNGADGAWAAAELLQGIDGALFGTTEYGGARDEGTLFRIELDGSAFQMLHSFDRAIDGRYPARGLCQAADGTLYGATRESNVRDGLVYQIDEDGSGFAVVHTFNDAIPNEGRGQKSTLLLASDGWLYGTAAGGGNAGEGTLVRLPTDGSQFEVLRSFSGGIDYGEAGLPNGPLHYRSDGSLLGTAAYGAGFAGVVFRHDTPGIAPTPLVVLPPADGAVPRSSLLMASDGLLYATAESGGLLGGGTLFRLADDGSAFQSLFHFDNSTGKKPNRVLVEGSDGALYGTTQDRGAFGEGTLFKIQKDGTGFQILLDFNSLTIGGQPEAGLLLGSDGRLYGSTTWGGPAHGGNLFAINPDGTGYVDLAFPWGNSIVMHDVLIEGVDGRLYGTASTYNGGGTSYLFAMKKDGTGYTILKTFDPWSSTYGHAVNTRLLQAADGALYGVATQGGPYGKGTLFRIEPDGSDFELLVAFDGPGNGANPESGLIQAPDGLLYGTTQWGGEFGVGTLFRVDLGCTATSRNYGAGFPGTLGVPTLVAQAPPHLGATLSIDLGSSATIATAAMVLVGEDTAALPVRKGGEILVEPLIILPLTIAPGVTTLSEDLPNDPALCGVRYYVQALLIDPGAARGQASTPGLELRLGS